MNTGTPNNLERRRHLRQPLIGMVTFLPGIGPETEASTFIMERDFVPARILNISEEGIGLEFTRTDWPHPIIRIRFELSPEKPVIVYAKMTWNKKNKAGFRFLTLSEPSRVLIRGHFQS